MLSVQMDPFGVFIEVYNRLTSPKPPYKVGKNNLENSRVLMTLSRSFWRRLGPSRVVWRARRPSGGFPARVRAARAHLSCASACLLAALARARAHVMTGLRVPVSCTLACHRLGVNWFLFLGSLDCLGLGWLLLGNAKEP